MRSVLQRFQQPLILLVLILALAVHHSNKNYTSPPMPDGYAKYAYALKTWGVFGIPASTTEKPEPGVGRAPLYPVFLAGMLAISPTHSEMVESWIDGEKGFSQDAGIVPYVQMGLMSIVGIVVFAIARLYGSNLFFAYLCSFAVLARLMGMAYHFRLSEVLAFPLFALTSYFLVLWYKQRPNLWYLVFAGLCLGLLALTRVVHLYFLPFVVLALVLIPPAGGRLPWKKIGAAVGVFVLMFAISVGPWMLRNASQHANAEIGDSGTDSVYVLRILYNTMTFEEAMAGTIFWLPDFGDNLAKKLFPEASKRFDFNERESFRRQRARYKNELSATLEEGESLQSAVKREFVSSVLTNPGGHLLAMVPLTVRGFRHIWLYLPFAFIALWYMRRDKQLLTITGASMMTILTYVLHVGATHFRGRYGYPMLVGVAPLAALGMTHLYTLGALKWRARKTT